MNHPKIYADFQKVDNDGFLVLTARGSREDLAAAGELNDGGRVVLYADDAMAMAILTN